MDRVDVDGLGVAYEQRGDGPPLVLLHGGMADHREWQGQLEGLSDEFTVVAWDAPGCGNSDDPPETFRMPEYADCLAGLIEQVDLGATHLLGLSWGSTLALELYRRRPDLANTLLLTGGYAGWAGSLPPEEVAARLGTFMTQFDQPAEQWVGEYIPTLLTERAPPEVVESLVAMMADSRPAGLRAMILAMAEADLRDVLPRITVPTLLLYGEEDVRSPLSVAEDLHRQIPGSTLVVMPGVGHQSNIETPERFNSEVRSFLHRT